MIHDPQLCVSVIQKMGSYSWTSQVKLCTMRLALRERLSIKLGQMIYTLVLYLGVGQSRRTGMF